MGDAKQPQWADWWSAIEHSPEYRQASEAERLEAKKTFFDGTIAPRVADAERDAARQHFFRRVAAPGTEDQLISDDGKQPFDDSRQVPDIAEKGILRAQAPGTGDQGADARWYSAAEQAKRGILETFDAYTARHGWPVLEYLDEWSKVMPWGAAGNILRRKLIGPNVVERRKDEEKEIERLRDMLDTAEKYGMRGT